MGLSEFVLSGGPMPTGVEVFSPSLRDAGWVVRWLNGGIDCDRAPRLCFDWDSRAVIFTNLLRPTTFWPKKTVHHVSVSFDDPLDVLVKYIEGKNCLIVRTRGAQCGFTRGFWQYDEIRDRFALIREIDAVDGLERGEVLKFVLLLVVGTVAVTAASAWYLSTI
ncbi:MAG: hypothetical protein AAFO89_13430 [Planctomycetota bacterium]